MLSCTFTVWHIKDAVYLNARGVSYAVLTSGQWDEVASYVEFMGYTQPWYSVRDVEAALLAEEGHIICYLRDGDRVFRTYSTTGRGNEPADTSMGLLDMTPYGRGEAWEDKPDGWPEGNHACWYWRSDADGNAHLGPDQPTRTAVDPPWGDPRRDPRPAGPRPLRAASDLGPATRSPPFSQLWMRWHIVVGRGAGRALLYQGLDLGLGCLDFPKFAARALTNDAIVDEQRAGRRDLTVD